MLHGRLHHIGADGYFASHGRHVLASSDEGLTWRRLASVPVGIVQRMKAATGLSRRLFRAEIHHIVPFQGSLAVFAFGRVWVLDRQTLRWAHDPQSIQGSRPLAVCEADGVLYYGEYRSNERRGPIAIMASADQGRSWREAYRCHGIRHVHGVFRDPFSGAVWFTTGDEDVECGIWRTDDHFASVRQILGGSQQFRAVDLLFTSSHVYFGTDTPLEQNYVYRFTRDGKTVERLGAMPSSVFYGARVGDRLFFGAVCEPSAVNDTRSSVISGSDVTGTKWEEVVRLKKDLWPIKYFQYGQARFPRGENRSGYLWFSPLSVDRDQTICRIKLEDCQ